MTRFALPSLAALLAAALYWVPASGAMILDLPFDTSYTSGGYLRTPDTTGNQTDIRMYRGASIDTTDSAVGSGSLSLDGVDDAVLVVPSAALQNFGGASERPFTIAFWMKPTRTTPQGQYIFERESAGDYYQSAVIYNYAGSNTELYAIHNPSGNPRPGSQIAVPTNEWTQVTYTYDGTTLTGYRDGEQVFSTPSSFTFSTNPSNVSIGSASFAGGVSPFQGNIDELRVYNTALTPTEVKQLVPAVSQPPKGPTAYTWAVLKDNPKFYWNFNETGNTANATELVRGQANDALVSINGAGRIPQTSPNLGQAAIFNGVNQYFMASNMGDAEMPGAWAVEFWMKANSTAPGQGAYLVNAGTGGGGPGNNPSVIYDFNNNPIDSYNNEVNLYSGSGRTTGATPANAPLIDDTGWHHIVLAFYGNGNGFGVADKVAAYVDGQQIPDFERSGFSAGFDLQHALAVGASFYGGGANFFNGELDELALYDLSGKSVSQVDAALAEIASHYQLASQPAHTDLYKVNPATISYTYNAGTIGGGVYADPNNRKLLDGVISSNTESSAAVQGFADGSAVGILGGADGHPTITFDLGGAQTLDSIFVDYLVNHPSGILAPTGVLVSFSLDGVTYTTPISFDDFNNFDANPLDGGLYSNTLIATSVRRAILNLNDPYARYVRLDFQSGGQWTFLSEVQFIAVPEPVTLGLLAMGLAGVGGYLRRRRAVRT